MNINRRSYPEIFKQRLPSVYTKPSYNIFNYDIFSAQGISNILIGVLLFAIFIGIFFFTYAVKIEKEILNKQITNLVENLLQDIKHIDELKSKISQFVESLKNIDLSEEDRKIKEENDKIIKKAVTFLSIFAVVIISIVAVLYFFFKINIKEIISTNVLLLLFIAITEIFFFNAIASKYISLDPNRVKLKIVEELQKLAG